MKTIGNHYTAHLLLSCLLALCSLVGHALPVRLYDAEQLSSNLITSICQDRQGYIWIGTEYGLNKFDGVHFKQYYADDMSESALSEDVVWKLMSDSAGWVWVLSNRSVQRYNPLIDGFETVTFNGSSTVHVNDMLVTPDGRVWVLQATGGVSVVADDLTAHSLEAVNKHLKQDTQPQNMYLDSRSRLWIAYETGLQMIDVKKGLTRFYDERSLHERRVMDVTEDEQGRLTVVTYTALLQLSEQTETFETAASYDRCQVHRLFHDNKGRLLIGTSGNGLWKVDTERHEVKPVSDVHLDQHSLRGERVYAYLQDQRGNQWVGCHQLGLLAVSSKPDSFHYLPLSAMERNNGNVLRSVFADSRQQVYVCQEKGGITNIDRQGNARNHWMGNHTVMTMYEDAPGRYWVGTYRNGLYHLDTETGREQWFSQTGTQRISSITRDLSGNLYTAVFGEGLVSYTPDGQDQRELAKGRLSLTNAFLNTLYTDHEGHIWIGHYYGIDVYDPQGDSLIDVSVPSALRSAIVYAISQSPDGSVWIGSNKGLFRYDARKKAADAWQRFTTREGLPNNIVCGVVVHSDGTVWVSTYRGLGQIDSTGCVTRFYRGNGLKEWAFLRSACAQSTSGIVIMGHQNGITYFSPDEITRDEFQHGITLTGMRLGNADVNASTRSGGSPIVSSTLETATDIAVCYDDNTFSLRFSSMDFRDAQNVHYEYRFADEPKAMWHETASGVSEIFFTHLSAGNHQLYVRAYDNGVYSPEKVLMLHVSPPWYRSWWAYVAYLLLVGGIALLWWRNYWNRRQAALNEEKIKLFVDLSHELRSPLTLIKSPLDQLLAKDNDATTRRALRNMERNTQRLLTLVDQVLSIRKIEKGQMTLHFSETPLGEFVGDICHDFDYLAERRNIKFTLTDEAPDMKVWIDVDHFDKVVTNLIGNAFKYVEDKGQIDVIVSRTADQKAELRVRDNGPGIDEAQLKKVFDRFYQASARSVAGQMSYGIGLNLTQKLTAMHKGTVTASNRNEGRGAEFVVRLPLGCAHLPKHCLLTATASADEAVATEHKDAERTTNAERTLRQRRRTDYRVIVVDDDDEMRMFLMTELAESYRVTSYTNGEKALEGIVNEVPDAVISDVVMPGMDGFQLLKRLKSNTETSHVPVILLTSKTERSSHIEGLDEGADAYVDKPFNMDELEALLSSLIGNRNRMRGKFSGRQEQEDTVRKIELKGNDEVLMERIMTVVNANLDDSDFNVEALANAVGLSRVQLHRRMKEMTGITVGEFIRNLRLQQAAKLLAKGDRSVAQVTYAVGFSNPTNFSTAFKKHFGVVPSEYIIRHRES